MVTERRGRTDEDRMAYSRQLDLFARTRHCYVAAAAYPRAFARPSDREESSDLCMVAAGCLGGIWARPLPLGAESLFVGPAMCALTLLSAKATLHTSPKTIRTLLGHFAKLRCQLPSINWHNSVRNPKKGFFCSINLV